MRNEAAGYRNRMQIAWKNVRANRGIRPVDFINGYRMVQPLRALNGAGPSMDMVQLIMEMFTRLEIRYLPCPVNEPVRNWSPPRSPEPTRHEPRVGLFVDAPDHLSGVCLTLNEWRDQALRNGLPLTLHACGAGKPEPGMVFFPPMGEVKLDAYAGLTLNIPRMDEIMRYAERPPFDVVHISTPGPMGLLGLLIARQHGLPVCGTYHTDFPRYAGALTGDPELEEVGWRFMRWFYGQMDRVAVPTESIRRELVEHGFDPARLRVVGRGVRTKDFHPDFRRETWRAGHGPKHPVKLLYVGRLSREKNLETLAQAFRRLHATRPDVCLVFVGDGPYRAELQENVRDLPVFFTGSLSGKDLAMAYASSDLFVFPSRTDTFGRVVLEAQASGLPVVVSDEGGPKDAMVDGVTGIVIRGINGENLAAGVDALTDDPARMAACRRQARLHAERMTPEASFDAFWRIHQSLESAIRSPRREVPV
ncbi:MAG TPA: glycosyltransferase family 1 protein [Kiritimatiellia bacterium]|nr:glycosyltransferase family 1 protein [Kiritimatiellia bacterium]